MAQSRVNLTTNDFGNFNQPTKSGLKFEDTDGSGVQDPGEPVIPNWPINLLKRDANNVFQPSGSVNTDVNGAYSFGPLGPGTYRVCEGTGPASFVQSFPNGGTPNPPGETITNQCAAPNTFGYEFTVQSGVNLTGNNFGNLPPQAENTLTIIKQANPQGPATFSFTASGGLDPANSSSTTTVTTPTRTRTVRCTRMSSRASTCSPRRRPRASSSRPSTARAGPR